MSQHLKVLKEAGLVQEEADGARRIYHIDPKGWAQLRGWLDQFWDNALDAFRAEVENANTRGNNEAQPMTSRR